MPLVVTNLDQLDGILGYDVLQLPVPARKVDVSNLCQIIALKVTFRLLLSYC